MTLFDSDTFNKLKWEKVTISDKDLTKLNEAIRGGIIINAEPIGYPLTAEVMLSIMDRHGEIIAVSIGVDEADGANKPYYGYGVEMATVTKAREVIE